MSGIKININGIEITANEGQTILQAATANGISIPTLCYDERVKIYGSCGICVVEIEGSPRLFRACATEAANGMVIKTDTPRVRESRKTALELLLSDHIGDCRPPCVLACPGETDCQGYVGLIANGEHKEAAKLIKEQLPLPASIGRVCPHPCETACRRQLVEQPINISMLKSFAADYDLRDAYIPEIYEDCGKKVAIVGGGPGGLTAAYYIRQHGVDVTVYDMMPKMGGMLRYGIPEYRLPKKIVDQEVAVFEKMGIKMVNGVKVGRDITLEHLRKSNDAVLLAIGAWTSMKMGVKGEDIEGVVGGIDFLRAVSLNEAMLTGKRIAVVGGGNTAMDAARTAVRLGASEVYIIYRRTKNEMPAERIEIEEAEEEGVIFKCLTNPIEFVSGDNGKLTEVRLQKMRLGEPDSSGRRSPVEIPGEEETLQIDTLVMAIGQIVNTQGFEDISLTKKRTIASDEKTFATNIEGVFAFGDATNRGASIAIEAIGEAKKAAHVVMSYFEGDIIPYEKDFVVERNDLTAKDFDNIEKQDRRKVIHLDADYRKHSFEEINTIYNEVEAMKEASRCLECGCHDFFECKLIEYANEYNVEPHKLAGEVHKRNTPDTHPFITRNQDKCILCGLCVRVCDEVMGISAFGLVDRGFDAVVKPAMDTALEKTDCISCGQCVSMCPTGALGEKLPVAKNVPVKQKVTNTTCSFCSVGCKTNIASKGSSLLRSTFDEDGYLCVNGKFGFSTAQNKRLTAPLIKRNGKLTEVELGEAITAITKKAVSVSMKYGEDAVGIAVSDRLTNEEMYMIKKYADSIGTKNIACYNSSASGLEEVLGTDASTNSFDELEATEVILLAYSDVMRNHAVAGIKIRKAVEAGAKLLILNNRKTLADEWAIAKEYSDSSTAKLAEFAKALIDLGAKPSNALGLDAFADSVSSITPSQNIKEMAEIYLKAKKAIIVFESYALSKEASALIAEISVISGHIGSPRNGIIQLLQNCNSAGVRAFGIGEPKYSDKTKMLISFGEDIADTSGLEELVVFDIFETSTVARADVVVPMASFAESNGTYTSADRKIQTVSKIVQPVGGYENWQLIVQLINAVKNTVSYSDVQGIQAEISANACGFKGYTDNENYKVFRPQNSGIILYEKGFHTEDGLANLQPYSECGLFTDKCNTNGIFNNFNKELEKLCLIETI